MRNSTPKGLTSNASQASEPTVHTAGKNPASGNAGLLELNLLDDLTPVSNPVSTETTRQNHFDFLDLNTPVNQKLPTGQTGIVELDLFGNTVASPNPGKPSAVQNTDLFDLGLDTTPGNKPKVGNDMGFGMMDLNPHATQPKNNLMSLDLGFDMSGVNLNQINPQSLKLPDQQSPKPNPMDELDLLGTQTLGGPKPTSNSANKKLSLHGMDDGNLLLVLNGFKVGSP